MRIDLDFLGFSANNPTTGILYCVLEKSIVLPGGIIPAGISQPFEVEDNNKFADLVPTKPFGISYFAYLLISGKRQWAGRFQVPATAKPGGGNWRLSDLIDLTPEGSTPDAAAESTIQKLLIDSRLIQMINEAESVEGVASFNDRTGAITLQESDIPAAIARDNEVAALVNNLAAAVTQALGGKENTGTAAALITTAIAAHLAAANPHPEYATDADLSSGLAGKADTSHPHTLTQISGLLTALEGKEAAGTAAGLVSSHLTALDPHPQYLTAAEVQDTIANAISGIGTLNFFPTLIRVQAEDYTDAYDTTPGNTGGAYRPLEDVDIQAGVIDAGGGFAIAFTAPTEWLSYNVNVFGSGSYRVGMRVASAVAGPFQIRLRVDGVERHIFQFSGTGGWDAWLTVYSGIFNIAAGGRTFRFELLSGDFRFNYFDIQPS